MLTFPPGEDLRRQAFAELLGTGLLVAVVVGSGIAGHRLSDGNTGLALLINAVATAGALVALITALGPVSGAHLNPVVTAADALVGGIGRWAATVYVAAQVAGACGGSLLANAMFERPLLELSDRTRTGGGQWLGEVVATFALLLVVLAVARSGRTGIAPFAVAATIAAGYFATSSTSFANPAVTVGRMLSDSFAGIAPGSAPGFIAAQLVGSGLAVAAAQILYPPHTEAIERG